MMTLFRLRAPITLRVLLPAACLAVLVAPSLPAQGNAICLASPQVRAALDKVPSDQTADQSEHQFLEARRSALEALMRQYPGDVFVERAYVRSMEYPESEHNKVIAEYKSLHEQKPDDAEISYLYGMTLVDRDTPQSIKLFTSALEKAPDLPWPHLQFVAIYSSPNFLDKTQAVSHESSFLAACPASLEGYSALRDLNDADLIRQHAPQLRQILQARTDPEALGAYSTLWALEFKAHPASEYDALRKQVAADVARLRALNLQDLRQWWAALEEGYKLTNDQKQSDWAKNESANRFPSPWQLPSRDQWLKDHPRPNDDAPFDQRQAYNRELLKQTNDWIKQRPNSIYIWYSRLGPVEDLDEVPAAEAEECVDKILKLAQADAGPEPVDSDTRFTLAEALHKRKLEPQRQVEMAQKGLQQLDEEAKQPPYDLYTSKKDIDDRNFYRAYQKAQGLFYEADGYVRLNQPKKAQAALADFDTALQALKSQINDKDDRRKSHAAQESLYWTAMARLAQSGNQRLEAMAYYESALLDRLESGNLPAPGDKDDLGDSAHQLWASLGGTDDGWNAWYGRRANALANQSHLTWETAQDPLPPFQLTDMKGKTWQLADLKGKVVFLNFWAAW
jgi:AhpC/TSA family